MDIFMLGNEALFDTNVMETYTGRVEKIAARSVVGLDRLATSQRDPFDLIYVDGSHERDDVMTDSILAWRLLKVGGVLIWDDYELISAMPGYFIEDQNPKPAIDLFLSWRKHELEVLHSGYQVIVRKLKPHHPASTLDPEKREVQIASTTMSDKSGQLSCARRPEGQARSAHRQLRASAFARLHDIGRTLARLLRPSQ